jgi:hypothetical protein
MNLFIGFPFVFSVHSDRFASHLQGSARMRLKENQISGWQVGMQRARQTGATGCVTLKGAAADRLRRMHNIWCGGNRGESEINASPANSHRRGEN